MYKQCYGWSEITFSRRKRKVKLHWSGKGLVFGEKPADKDRARIVKQSYRVGGWWLLQEKQHNALRQLAKEPRVAELTREVVEFWMDWFSYEHLPPCEMQRDWLQSLRGARLGKIRALARHLDVQNASLSEMTEQPSFSPSGVEALAEINTIALLCMLPMFGNDEASVQRAESAHVQFQREGYWWPYDIPAPSGARVSIPPCWRGAFLKAAK